ncbi:4256_t:CDS:2, partial [Paraglomus occultum]
IKAKAPGVIRELRGVLSEYPVDHLISFAETRSSNPTLDIILDRIKELVEKCELDYLQLRQMIIQLRIETNNRIETHYEVQQLRAEFAEFRELLQ